MITSPCLLVLAVLMIAVNCQEAVPNSVTLVESNPSLLLDRSVSFARGIERLKKRKAQIMLTNFTEEYQQLNKRAAVVFLEDIQEESELIAVTYFQRGYDDASNPAQFFDVNSAQSQGNLKKLRSLLSPHSDCFSSTSKFRHTPLAKHRIIS